VVRLDRAALQHAGALDRLLQLRLLQASAPPRLHALIAADPATPARHGRPCHARWRPTAWPMRAALVGPAALASAASQAAAYRRWVPSQDLPPLPAAVKAPVVLPVLASGLLLACLTAILRGRDWAWACLAWRWAAPAWLARLAFCCSAVISPVMWGAARDSRASPVCGEPQRRADRKPLLRGEGGWPWLPLALSSGLPAQRRTRPVAGALVEPWHRLDGVAVGQTSCPVQPLLWPPFLAGLAHLSSPDSLWEGSQLRSSSLFWACWGLGPSGHFAADSPCRPGFCRLGPSVPALSSSLGLAAEPCCWSGFHCRRRQGADAACRRGGGGWCVSLLLLFISPL